ncbi:MAG: rod shape-determining protein MreD [Lachnospiraceae bacterium]|nr:rod shape-determining protein MreD [Lachnospiraceae bacterium]
MKQMMIRIIVYACIIIGSFTLQTSVFHFFSLANITPNFMLITVVAAGMMRGRKAGIAVGFFSGLLLDIFFGEFLGVYAFIYMMIGFINGFFNHMFYAEEAVFPIAMVAANDLVYGIVIYFFFYLMRSKWNFFIYFKSVILPELVYTLLAGLVFYFILLWADSKLTTLEKRSA